MFWLRALLAWLGFAALAVACGALRVKLVEPLVGPAAGHVLGTLAVCLLLFLLIRRFVRRIVWRSGASGPARLSALGGFWAALTIAFEFGFGHYVAGHPWERLLADYDLFAGRIWVLVLVVLGLGPLLASRLELRRGRGMD